MLTESFFDREDIELTDRLATELPGILNWAIEGWISLQKRGHFVQPKSSEEVISELEYLGSPISEFIRDRCVTGPEFSVPIEELFKAWKQWCQSQGSDRPGTTATFGKDLRATAPGIKKRRLQINRKQESCYEGIRLRE